MRLINNRRYVPDKGMERNSRNANRRKRSGLSDIDERRERENFPVRWLMARHRVRPGAGKFVTNELGLGGQR